MSLIQSKLSWMIRKATRERLNLVAVPNFNALLRDIDAVIDVGANIGSSYDFFRSVGFKGQIISYEPSPKTYKALEQRKGYNWIKRQKGLGENSGMMKFYHREGANSDSDGFLPLSGKRDEEPHTLVECGRLEDEPLPQGNLFLKIDTEGNDLFVLRGAMKLLPQIKLLMLEISTIPRFKGEPEFLAVLAEVERMGFNIHAFYSNFIFDGPDPILGTFDNATRTRLIDVIFKAKP